MAQGLQGGLSAVSFLPTSPTGNGMAMTAPAAIITDGGKKPTEDELNRFGNFANSTDTKEVAKYLMNKGLVGADQLYTDHPDISTRGGVVNSQSDWKPAAISKMLIQAKALGIKSPESVTQNRAALMAGLDDRVKVALNHPSFSQIHPNFWSVFKDILKDQYANESADKSAKMSLASK